MKEKKATAVFFDHSFEEYSKKFGNIESLLRYTFAYTVEYEKKHGTYGKIPNDYEEFLLLQNHHWWLINDVFYEVPSKSKAQLLYTRAKQSVVIHSLLIGTIAASSIFVPSLIVTHSCEPILDIQISKDSLNLAEIKNTTYSDNGDLSFQVVASISKEKVNSVKIAIGANPLIEDNDFTFNSSDGKVVINKLTLSKNSGTILVTPSTVVAVTGIKLNKESLTFVIFGGDKPFETLIPTVLPSDAGDKSVIWSSSNKEVASVDQTGKVSVAGNGECKIAATTYDGNKTAYCSVSVTTAVTGVRIKGDSKRNLLIKNDQERPTTIVEAEVLPTTASNKEVRWEYVDDSAKYVTIKDFKNGKCQITGNSNTPDTGVEVKVITNDGSYSAKVTIFVTTAVQEISLNYSSLNLYTNTSSSKKTAQLFATIYPSSASNKKVLYSSSNPNVASVDNESGLVTALNNGEAVIICSATDGSEVTASCSVSVTTEVEGVSVNKKIINIHGNGASKDEREALVTAIFSASGECEPIPRTIKWVAIEGADLIEKISSTEKTCNIVAKKDKNGVAKVKVIVNDDENLSDICVVNVSTYVEGITLDKHNITLESNSTKKSENLLASILPSSAGNQNVIWSIVSGSEYLELTSVGKEATLTVKEGVDSGVARIEVKTEEFNYKDYCDVIIVTVPSDISIDADKKEIESNTEGKNKAILKATISPEKTSFKDVKWEIIEGQDIASLESPSTSELSNTLIANKNKQGNVKIKVTSLYYNDISSTIVIKVIEAVKEISFSASRTTLISNDETQNTAQITPIYTPSTATNKKLLWSIISGDEYVESLTINEDYSALVKAKTNVAGEIVLEAKTEDKLVKNSITLNVISDVKNIKFKEDTYYLTRNGDIKTLDLKNEIIIEPEVSNIVEYRFSSSDSEIVSVNDDGVISAINKKSGEAIITVNAKDINGNEVSANTNVKVLTDLEGVTIVSDEVIKLFINGEDEALLKFSFLPLDADIKEVSWTVDNNSIASINKDESGKYTIKGLKQGETILTLKVTDSNGHIFSDTKTVNVKKAASFVDIIPDSYYLESNSATYNKTNLTLVVDESTTIEGARWFITSGNDIACLEKDKTTDNKNVLASNEGGSGEVIIKVTPIGATTTASVLIHVNIGVTSLEVTPNIVLSSLKKSESISINALPNDATIKSATFEIVGDKSIAYVDSTGLVTGLKPGEVDVKVTSTDKYNGKEISNLTHVKVNPTVTINTNGGSEVSSFDVD